MNTKLRNHLINKDIYGNIPKATASVSKYGLRSLGVAKISQSVIFYYGN